MVSAENRSRVMRASCAFGSEIIGKRRSVPDEMNFHMKSRRRLDLMPGHANHEDEDGAR